MLVSAISLLSETILQLRGYARQSLSSRWQDQRVPTASVQEAMLTPSQVSGTGYAAGGYTYERISTKIVREVVS